MASEPDSNGMDSSSPIGIGVPNWLLHHQLTVQMEESTMKISRVGVDLAKNVFQLHGVDTHGKTVSIGQIKGLS